MSPDPHSVLNVQPGAGRDEILAAYRRAALRTHPDHGGNAEQFRQVRDAYLRLSDDDVQTEAKASSAGTPALVEVKVTPAMAKVGAIVRVPLPKWVECDTCDAIGVLPKRRRTCAACDGSGHVEEPVQTHPFLLPCPQCQGTGHLGTRCPDCTRGQRLASLQRKVRLPKGCQDGAQFKLDGRPAFVVKIVQPSE